jgi:RHS repeat-associated protein
LAFTDAFLDRRFRPADSDPIDPPPPPPPDTSFAPAPSPLSARPVYLNPNVIPNWPAEYPLGFRDQLPSLAGYVHYQDTDVPGSPGGYYVTSERHRYDVHVAGHVARGLSIASMDSLGSQAQVEYDVHDVFPVQTTDAAGLTTTATHDYRALQPRELTDSNGTVRSVEFSPAGLVTAQFARGADGTGDRDVPSVWMSYDLLAFVERGQPASVRTVRRINHDTATDVPAERRDDIIVSVAYSDGLGRTLQIRAQAEDILFGDPTFGGGVIPADQLAPVGDTVGRNRGPADPDNVIVSGAQIYDNKGRVVHKYEPYFATGFDYAAPIAERLGVRTTMFYDPRGKVIRTVRPDGGEERIVPGVPTNLTDPDVFVPTPWESYLYDANDNAGRTHGATATAFQTHWNTPTSHEIDALGRTVVTVARNGTTAADQIITRARYDILGNLVGITDARGRESFRYQFDLAKRRWRMESIDAGRRDTVFDALGHEVESRDSKGAATFAVFDILHRPSRTWASDDAAGTVTLRQLIEYGDGGSAQQPPADRDAARARHLLGRMRRHHDEAGLVTVVTADFKGNVRESRRQVIADAPILATYQAAVGHGWQVTPFQVDWTPAPGQTQDDRDLELLEPAGYTTNADYDALNRLTRHVFPSSVDGQRHELRPTYNRAGELDQVRLDDTVFVQRIGYDAKGQRALIAYGNGVMTRYAYDPHTFRLIRLRTEPYTLINRLTYRPAKAVMQDLGYAYDLVGNIRTIRDRAPGSGILNNPAAANVADPVLRKLIASGNALDRRFDYDPVYRLVSATGREHPTAAGDPWTDNPRGTDITQAQAYAQTYRYDAVGSMLELIQSGKGAFSRTFTVAPDSNRLQRLTVGATSYGYAYDANSNLVVETTSRHFQWNHADRLKAFASQTAGAEPSVHAQYLYDTAGQRVKKLVRRQGGAVEATHYLDGVFEHHRWSGGANNHLHVMDGKQRIALIRVGAARPDDTGPATAFHLADHLGSSAIVVDGTGAVTNTEEFTPYGETSFGSYTRKRYRFTGKERDEESGLGYHGARYYAPWLARWCAADPLILDHDAFAPTAGRPLNPYGYCNSSPLGAIDPDGRDVHILVDSSGRDIDYAAVATRKFEIENSPSFDPTKDAVYPLQVLDLGTLKDQIAAVRADAAKRGFGETVEFSVWGHAGSDGPVGAKPNSGPDPVDKNQMTIQGWNKIDFGWRKDTSFAAFYGCSADTFAEKFFNAQKAKGLGKAGYFDTSSYPSLHPTNYVRDRNGWGVDAIAEDIRKGKRTVSQNLGIWYIGIEKWDHRINTLTGSDVNERPMRWVRPSQWWVPPPPQQAPVPAPRPAPAPVPPQPAPKPVPLPSGGVLI